MRKEERNCREREGCGGAEEGRGRDVEGKVEEEANDWERRNRTERASRLIYKLR